ncbi:hypothetical protein ACE1ET_05375 [Saccharicrinis sp. FJH62]|uniref:hypothetical protein n=1 Tax=Saccharicrinis sp. FJH62 TaxID=3344657 RepID=UPI0035D42567
MDKYDAYMPVDPDFFDVLEELRGQQVRIFWFNRHNELADTKGICRGVLKADQGEFVYTGVDQLVRLDNIITVNGRPGPAFDKYDAYANACLSCMGGYE